MIGFPAVLFINYKSGSNEKTPPSYISRETAAFFTFPTLLNCSGANEWNIVFMAKAWVTTSILLFFPTPCLWAISTNVAFSRSSIVWNGSAIPVVSCS